MDSIKKALQGTSGCRVQIITLEGDEARATGLRLQEIFQACGYVTDLRVAPGSSRDGIFIASSPESAGSALILQSAFNAAGIDTTVAIHERNSREMVVIHVGPGGIPETKIPR